MNTFDGIYLSWDPAGWQKSLVFHGYVNELTEQFLSHHILQFRMWKRNGSIEDGTDFFLHPKYSIIAYQFSLASRHVRLNFNTTSLAEEEIWVLLTRHVVQTSRNLDFIALRIEIEDNILPAVLPMNQLNSLSTVSSIELYNFVDSNYLFRGRTRTVRTSWWVMQNYIFFRLF